MRIGYADLAITNPVSADLQSVKTKALADTGAVHLCLPSHIALQLALETREEREVTLADGSRKHVPYVGPVGLQFANRRCFVGALVMGDEVLLGAIPMEDMDPLAVPIRREVIVNPASPNIPSAMAKGVKRASRLNEALLETAGDMHRLGIMNEATYEKIRPRHLGENLALSTDPTRVEKPARRIGK